MQPFNLVDFGGSFMKSVVHFAIHIIKRYLGGNPEQSVICITKTSIPMNKRVLLLLSAVFFFTALSAQVRPTGEVFDAELYNSLPLKAKVSTRSILPPQVSLEKFCPTPGNQGDYMTCAAWSSAYHFRTIIEAKQRGITNQADIDKLVYSPTWVYEILKPEGDDSCGEGLATARSLLVFKELGVPSYATLPFSCLAGDQKVRFAKLDPMMAEAQKARIRDLQILFLAKEGVDPQEKIRAIKKVLAEGYPVLVSHTLYDSFHGAKDVWRTLPAEATASDRHGSHAMVIVGYDDDKHGGAFRYLNSWGPDWGDGGFIWVPYTTTGDLCYGAYQAFPFPLIAPSTPPAPAPAPKPSVTPAPAPAPPAPVPVAENLPSGSMEFRLRDGAIMPVARISSRGLITEDDSPAGYETPAYRASSPYPSGTRFRFYMETENEGYVYAFASDLSQKVNKIFPYDNQVSALIGANSIVAFPADTKVIRMDENPGTDYLLVLYSQQELDTDLLEKTMAVTSGGLVAKVKAALGNALIDPAMVDYQANAAGFSVKPGATGTVVPVLVEISHQ